METRENESLFSQNRKDKIARDEFEQETTSKEKEKTNNKEEKKLSATQRKNRYRKIFKEDTARLFEKCCEYDDKNLNKSKHEYPFDTFIPEDSLEIQIEFKRFRDKLWRQLNNLPRNERSSFSYIVKEHLLRFDALINKGRFVPKIRKQVYPEAQTELFLIRSAVEQMYNMSYISQGQFINYDMSMSLIGKQLTNLIKSSIYTN